MSITSELFQELSHMPVYDAHTHIGADHLTARGLDDVLLYHMVISDLYSAGCPSGSRIPEYRTQDLAHARLEEAIPYVPLVQNTSCMWGVRLILRDLYGIDEPITRDNWREIDRAIAAKASPEWAREIFHRAGIVRGCTELWRGHDGRANDMFQYSLEWAFFTRCQWGQFDTSLLELEHAWGQEVPGAPLPVTLSPDDLSRLRPIRTLEDVDAAIAHYVERIPYGKVISAASHLSTDINYRRVSEDEMAGALKRRDRATPAERDIYANYIFEKHLEAVQSSGHDLLLQFSFGAEPLPYESGSKLRSESVFELAQIVARYPGIRFNIFLSSAHQNQALCTLARELPNLSLSGYWWHNFFPEIVRRVMSERLDMLSTAKQVGFFSDAYCVDWAYAKAIMVRAQLAQVLAQRVQQGQYDAQTALEIARQLFQDTPRNLLGMRQSEE